MYRRTRIPFGWVVLAGMAILAADLGSRISADDAAKAPSGTDRDAKAGTVTQPDLSNPKAKRVSLNPAGTVVVDFPGKRVLLTTKVVLREGTLEMLCCLKQTKEHESILSLDAKAYLVHTGLLALGAKSGKPVQFQPEFQPPTGQPVDIFLQWTDENGKPQRVPAQRWIQHARYRFFVATLDALPKDVKIPDDSALRYDVKSKELTWYGPMTAEQRDHWLKPSQNAQFQEAIRTFFKQSQPKQMDAKFVFAGSGFFVDEKTGERFYNAEQGDLICVANFPSATIDVAIESTATGSQNLLFEAYTERIPAVDTEVTVELVPILQPAESQKRAGGDSRREDVATPK